VKQYAKYSRAREQIYHYKVGVRQHHESISPKRRTQELVQLMEMVESLVDAVTHACENGQVVAMQLDIYDVVRLPGFDDHFGEMKSPLDDPED